MISLKTPGKASGFAAAGIVGSDTTTLDPRGPSTGGRKNQAHEEGIGGKAAAVAKNGRIGKFGGGDDARNQYPSQHRHYGGFRMPERTAQFEQTLRRRENAAFGSGKLCGYCQRDSQDYAC